MRIATTILVVSIAAAAALPSAAHDHATGVVKERMDMMELMAKHLKAIRERVDGKRNLSAIKTDAEAIASHAAHVPHLFPPGSTQPPTEARSTIWQNWADFESKAKALEAESRKLAQVPADDRAALTAQSRAVTQACAACHETYRVRKARGRS